MLEKYKIKFCLSVPQTFNHDNLCLCAILTMICISIMEMRIPFCVCATKGHCGPFLKVCHDQNIASALKLNISCAAQEIFQLLSLKN